MYKLRFTKFNGDLTAESKKDFRVLIDSMPDGTFNLIAEQVNVNYKSTRYKYYFDCVLNVLLRNCSELYKIIDYETGELKHPRNTDDFHWIMKSQYNSITIIGNGKAWRQPNTTRKMSDKEFYQYIDTIIQEHSGPPFNCEFPTPPEYAQLKKSGHWDMITK